MRIEAKGDIFEARLGSLYKYSSENGFDKLKSNISVSNGLTWNEKAKKMYYIDSCDLDVKEFDYDSVTGALCKWFEPFNSDKIIIILFLIFSKRT